LRLPWLRRAGGQVRSAPPAALVGRRPHRPVEPGAALPPPSRSGRAGKVRWPGPVAGADRLRRAARVRRASSPRPEWDRATPRAARRAEKSAPRAAEWLGHGRYHRGFTRGAGRTGTVSTGRRRRGATGPENEHGLGGTGQDTTETRGACAGSSPSSTLDRRPRDP
jgi:hypothetical protein